MPRKIIVEPDAGAERKLLTETLAKDEHQLQELVKEHPDLLPIEDFDLAGPVMVIGRETGLASGAVDLVALVRSGDLLLIEFKTGPQNSDFRAALAQLLDYGSACWGMTVEEFEQAVAVRYFTGERCTNDKTRGLHSLDDAARKVWNFDEAELSLFRDRLARQLADGTMLYVLVAQRFTGTMEGTMEYLNSITPSVNFWAVELVRFVEPDGMSAFESRTLLRPRTTPTSRERIDQAAFLDHIDDGTYREALRELLDATSGLGFQHAWGSTGTSFRLGISGVDRPVSLAWLFRPGVSGWMGLRDLTLGVETYGLDLSPKLKPILERYLNEVAQLPGVEPWKAKNMRVYHVDPATLVQLQSRITELLATVSHAAADIG